MTTSMITPNVNDTCINAHLYSKVDVPNWWLILIGYLYLSGTSFGVDLKMDTKKTCV